jgi:kinesin family member 18/19
VSTSSGGIHIKLTWHRVFDPPEDNPIQKFSRAVTGPTGKRVKDQTFGFDRIFDENVTQGEVYEATTRPLLDNVFDGYNATVFAYGATGCGKTHTITGTVQQPGIIFMTMQELFERISECGEEKVTETSLSYLEIYNETIRDLLSTEPSPRGGLMLREDANQAVSVAGLSSHHPQSVEQVMEMVMRGNELRTMSPTEANATSSRSHAVLQINVAQKDRNANIDEPHTMATLSIIDLAGSERASATKNRGARLTEGANINKSLLSLGSCINALCDPRKRNHVPYRNSKLTRLLKFSLGGNCKTVMIVCVSPSSQHFDETQNTLRYANRAKNIQTKVTRNVYNVNRHVKDFLVKIDEQMALINELKATQKDQENLAFAKFKKQNEKKETIAREGIQRIRAAYENSATERQERAVNIVKLRQIGRRIAMLSSWIAAFDTVCDGLEEEEPMKNMQAARKSAQGIMVELENSRHHCKQKVAKSTWDRAMNSALENGLRALQEVDTGDNIDASTLRREVEFLKANAEREALASAADQDKAGDAGTIQVLLQSLFETVAAIDGLNKMSVDEAIDAANETLGKVLNSTSNAASHVVKPDGSLAPIEIFAPTKTGTPKRRKYNTSIPRGTPIKPFNPNPVLEQVPHLVHSPMIGSPKRRGLLGSAKKGVSFTPKKRRSPVKGVKRAVRWRDDTEDGSLVEFQKTPQKVDSSPEESTGEVTLPEISNLTQTFANLQTATTNQDSSPLPTPPESTLSAQSKSERFKTGFLSKKSDGSPNMMPPPRMTLISSDSESSPLRDLNGNNANKRASNYGADLNGQESLANSSSSDTENAWKSSGVDKSDARRISSAMRRSSSVRSSGVHGSISRSQRRRSPTAATSATGSPASDNGFAAGHVRRMVHGAKENDWKVGVLSPRVQGVISRAGTRRTTVGNMDGPRSNGTPGHSRMSSVHSSGGMSHAHGVSRDRASYVPGAKGTWR